MDLPFLLNVQELMNQAEVATSVWNTDGFNNSEDTIKYTVQFRLICHPCDAVTRLTKFSFRHLDFEGVTRSGFRQVSD